MRTRVSLAALLAVLSSLVVAVSASATPLSGDQAWAASTTYGGASSFTSGLGAVAFGDVGGTVRAVATSFLDASNPFVWSDDNGDTWTAAVSVTDATHSSVTMSPREYEFRDITHDGSHFVAAGRLVDGSTPYVVVATSPDGKNWTMREVDGLGQGAALSIDYVGPDGSEILVLGASSGSNRYLATTSDNGTTWSKVAIDTGATVYGAAYGASMWVLATESGLFSAASATSPNWTARAVSGGPTQWNDVAFNGTTFLAVGRCPTSPSPSDTCAATSPDGTTWTAKRIGGETGAVVSGLALTPSNEFIAVGNTSDSKPLAYRYTGSTWVDTNPPTADGRLYDVALAGANVLAIGGTGNPLTGPLSLLGGVASVPGAPAQVAIDSYTAASVTLTVTAPASNGGSPITGYKVGSCDYVIGGSACNVLANRYIDVTVNDLSASVIPITIDLTTPPADFGVIRAGFTRSFFVVAVNLAGVGAAASASQDLNYPAPDAPTVITATPTQDGAVLTFTQGANWGASVISELQYAQVSSSTWANVTVAAPVYARTSGTITGLDSGTEYTIALRGARTANNVFGPASTPVTFTTLAGPPSGAYDDTCDLEGSGTAADPYLIDIVDDLYEIRDCGPDVAGTAFKQTADLDLAGAFDPSTAFDDNSNSLTWGWMPLGQDPINGPSPFTMWAADYDGGGHTISNFTMNVDGYTPSLEAVGFFGKIIAGTIKDLTFVDASVSNTGYAAPTGVLGSADAGEFGPMLSPPPPPPETIGDDVVISNVSVSGTVDNQSTPYSSFSPFGTGGLLGLATVSDSTNHTLTIEDVYADVDVTATGDGTGGLIGKFERGTISGGVAAGDVSGAADVGGLFGVVGYGPTGPDLVDLFASGAVSGTGADVGGAIGSSAVAPYPSDITNVSWNIDTSGQTTSALAPPITGLTAAEAADPANYPGLDFTVWGICADVNDGQPVLQASVTLPDGLEWSTEGTCVEAADDSSSDDSSSDDSASSDDSSSTDSSSDDSASSDDSSSSESSSDDSTSNDAADSDSSSDDSPVLERPSSTTPTQLDDDQLAAVERAPGEVSATINGEPVYGEVVRVTSPAASVAPENRTEEQVAEVRAQARAMVDAFNERLDDADNSPVSVIDTATGAAVRGLAVRTDDGTTTLDVPAEDVVALVTAEQGLLITGVDADDEPSDVSPSGVLRVGANGQVAVAATGLTPGAAGEVVVMSTPTLIGTFTVGDDGLFRGQAQLPAGLSGQHTVVATADGLTFAVGIEVTGAAVLPATGSMRTMLPFAVLLLAIGAAAVMPSRRRPIV